MKLLIIPLLLTALTALTLSGNITVPFTNTSQLIPQDEYAILINPGQLIKYQWKDNNFTMAQNQTFSVYSGTGVVTGNSTQHLLHYTQGIIFENGLANIGNIQKDLDKLNVAQTHSDIPIEYIGIDPLMAHWILGYGQMAFSIGSIAQPNQIFAHYNDSFMPATMLKNPALAFFPLITTANDTSFKAAVLGNASVSICSLVPPFEIANATFNANHTASYCAPTPLNQTFVDPQVSMLNGTVYIFDQMKTYSMNPQNLEIQETENISNLNNATIVASAYEMDIEAAAPKIPFVITENNGTFVLSVLQ